MSKPVSGSDKKGVLPSVRRLVDDSKAQDGASERLVLSSDLRVPGHGVLRLEPQHAVKAERDRESIDTSSEQGSKESITPAAKQGPGDERQDIGHHLVQADAPGSSQADNSPSEVPKAFGISELTAKIAALETTIARTADQWEPDGMSRDAYSGTQPKAMSWQDSVELDAKGTPLAEESPAQPADTSGHAEIQHVVDQTVLRDLVAEMVRSELQGALGERITQNLRKLVRREIQRALASRDLG
ncbi:MAG: hypothetical protein R8G34_06350 [Paracoccaceae bacterium]|nr:hypothetical protein [Paracoccaceae bacterium]